MNTVFSILIFVLIPCMANASEQTCSKDAREKDAQCGTYCLQVVKPLLNYASSIRSKEEQFLEQEGKIRELELTIVNKESQLIKQTELTASKDALIASLQSQIKSKESQSDEKDKQIGSLKSQLKNKESNITKKAGEVVKLKSVIKEKDVQIANLNSTNAEKAQQFAELQGKIRDQATNIASLKETTASKDVLIANLQSEKDKQMDKLQKDSELNVVKTKQLESRIAEYEAILFPSSCINKSTDLHRIKVPVIASFSVPCDSKIGGGGWTVIQRRINGSVDFNRNWEEYKEGFGDLRGEFFFGLEKLHLLTKSQPHELYIHMENLENETYYAKYSHFVIGNETEAYEIKMLGERYGVAEDAMEYHLNMKFTTKDRDNDKWETGNCAVNYESGWWFKKCGECNLNGLYREYRLTSRCRFIKLKSAQMMIRPTRA